MHGFKGGLTLDFILTWQDAIHGHICMVVPVAIPMSHLKLCFCLVVYSCVNVIDLIKVVWFIIKFYLIRLDLKLKPYFFNKEYRLAL